MRTCQHLAALIARHTRGDGVFETPLPRVSLSRSSAPSEPMHTLYSPSFCLIAQGQKEVTAGGKRLVYDPSSVLVVGMDLPAIGAVTSASQAEPYLGLRLEFDRAMLADILVRRAQSHGPAPAASTVATSTATPEIIDASARLLELLEEPDDAPHLARLVEQELVHRLLSGPQGALLRQIGSSEGRFAQIDRAVRFIRSSYREAFSIEALAAMAGMSVSAFHDQFRAVTTMTPLQFRNHIRLHEARRLMIMEGLTAAEAGFAVGYDSPSQFSRDYARIHQVSPKQDVTRLRAQYASLA